MAIAYGTGIRGISLGIAMQGETRSRTLSNAISELHLSHKPGRPWACQACVLLLGPYKPASHNMTAREIGVGYMIKRLALISPIVWSMSSRMRPNRASKPMTFCQDTLPKSNSSSIPIMQS